MKSFILTTVIVLGLLGTRALAADQAEKQSFELTPAAPPKPALKYQLMFDDLGDRLPGNAAILYLDSVLLLSADTRDKIQHAVDIHGTDKAEFGAVADSLETTSLIKELELAGRRTECDWETPVPANPMTGKPFTYAVANGVATISDSTPGDQLEYTVKIRK